MFVFRFMFQLSFFDYRRQPSYQKPLKPNDPSSDPNHDGLTPSKRLVTKPSQYDKLAVQSQATTATGTKYTGSIAPNSKSETKYTKSIAPNSKTQSVALGMNKTQTEHEELEPRTAYTAEM